MENYLNIFIDENYPSFIDKYLNTRTLNRLKHITQFCGCDYTHLYSPLFLYTRFDHSLVVAHMTWHFTHDKKETLAALLHDVGTPCFAHCIDYLLGDSAKQESSEKKMTDVIFEDSLLVEMLAEDGILVEELDDLEKYPILENHTPRLCTDRLDGILHTAYIWLHTHSLEEIKEVYEDMTVLENEEGLPEIGFNNVQTSLKFVEMIEVYAKELQSNTNKYTMKYVSEMVGLAISKKLIVLDDLYIKKEEEIVDILNKNFPSWEKFKKANHIIRTEEKPNQYYVSIQSKKRKAIPLVKEESNNKRIAELSEMAEQIYLGIDTYKDTKYAYIASIEKLY